MGREGGDSLRGRLSGVGAYFAVAGDGQGFGPSHATVELSPIHVTIYCACTDDLDSLLELAGRIPQPTMQARPRAEEKRAEEGK